MGFVYRGLKGVKQRQYECEQRRCTARDFNGLAMGGRLYIASAGNLGKYVIEPRIRDIKGMLSRWRSGVALMGAAMDAALQTVPDDQWERMGTIFEHGVLDINLPRVRINEQGGSVLAVNGAALECVVHHAMRNECGICIKERHEVKQCELYQALKGVIEPESWESSTCPYRDELLRQMKKGDV